MKASEKIRQPETDQRTELKDEKLGEIMLEKLMELDVLAL